MKLLGLNEEQYRTLKAIFEIPARSDISWLSLNALLVALGGTVREYDDRVCVVLQMDKRAVLHRRDQQEYVSSHAVEGIRDFLRLVQIEVYK